MYERSGDEDGESDHVIFLIDYQYNYLALVFEYLSDGLKKCFNVGVPEWLSQFRSHFRSGYHLALREFADPTSGLCADS